MPITVEGNLKTDLKLSDGLVRQDGDLSIDIDAFHHEINGVKYRFSGVSSKSVTDNAKNFVFLDTTGSLVVNTSGFPSEQHIRLANVFATGSVITAITDKRALLVSAATGSGDGVSDHGNLSGLGDDDHTQYLLADGTRNLGGNWNLGGNDLSNGGFVTATGFSGSLTRLDDGGHYLLAEGSISITTGSTGQITISGSSSSGTSDHGQLSGLSDDDHPQYQLTSSKGQANGYAGLDGNAEITDSTHGNRGGGNLHTTATTSSAGFMSGFDKEKVELITSGTTSFSIPLDIGVVNGNCNPRVNNNMSAMKYEESSTNTDGEWRFSIQPPKNYIDGDLKLRALFSTISDGGNNEDSLWELQYAFRSEGEDLGSYTTIPITRSMDSVITDKLETFSGSIPETDVSKSADILFINLRRKFSDNSDSFGEVYVHNLKFVFNGWEVADSSIAGGV